MIAASFLWLYIIRHFDFSIVCTTISISYVFGMLAAVYIFHEAVPVTRWVGAFLIICGIILVVK
jgi:undecaprenyl phosphate-alpha-L-ara4N flippase subunit ArnE